MEVICLDEPAFYALIEKVVSRIKDEHQIKEDKWITADEAMKLLNITSKTTLLKIFDEGKIKRVNVTPRVILYSSNSIRKYLEENSKGTF